MKINIAKKNLLMLILITVLMVIGCASGNEDDQNEVTESTEEEGEKTSIYEYITVGFSKGPSQGLMESSIEEQLRVVCEERGSGYVSSSANGDLATQLTQIEQMLEGELQYLVIEPIQESGYEGILQRASDKGVSVIVIKNPMQGSFATYIKSDSTEPVNYGEAVIEVIDQLNKNEQVDEVLILEADND